MKARVRGYQDALADLGGAGRVLTMRAHQPMEWTAEARECEAFVCANDRVAGRWMQTLLEYGVRIPRDVRIVGIDDVNYASLLPVPLTTVHQPCREIGEAALRVMLERLETAEDGGSRRVAGLLTGSTKIVRSEGADLQLDVKPWPVPSSTVRR